ncbi:hypothetical protein Tco_0265980 [Tanacetum coccineum]
MGVKVNLDILVKAVQDQLQRELEVQISMSKAFRAKDKAEKEIRGDHGLQYSMLRDYVVERDLLGLDCAFMKGPFPSQVLVVVGLDSNNGIYPLAYALVEAESGTTPRSVGKSLLLVDYTEGNILSQGGNNAEASGSASRQAQQTEPAIGQDGSCGSGAGIVIVCLLLLVNVVQVLAVKVHLILDGQREEYKQKELVHKKELPLNLQVNLLSVLKCQIDNGSLFMVDEEDLTFKKLAPMAKEIIMLSEVSDIVWYTDKIREQVKKVADGWRDTVSYFVKKAVKNYADDE